MPKQTDRDKAEQTSNVEELIQLSGSNEPGVRFEVASNLHTPQTILEMLALDPVESVASKAKSRLGPETISSIPDYYFSVLQNDPTIQIEKNFGLVYGTSSKMALGTNKQSTRLNLAADAALEDLRLSAMSKGANGVIGIQFALNSSQGANAALMGSSEGVMVYGNAILFSPLVDSSD